MLRSYGIKKNGIRDFGLVGFSFSGPIPILGLLYDIDGNVYTTVTLGSQEWIIENLKTIHYADGTVIPTGLDLYAWIAEDGTPGHDGTYTYLFDNIQNKSIHGAMYNWYSVNNLKGLVYFERNGIYEPQWRISRNIDYTQLLNFLGGVDIAGGKIKEVGNTNWIDNFGATNSSGLTCVATGVKNCVSDFNSQGTNSFWWSSDSPDIYTANVLIFYNDSINVQETVLDRRMGITVRCMRDI